MMWPCLGSFEVLENYIMYCFRSKMNIFTIISKESSSLSVIIVHSVNRLSNF